MDGSIYAQRPDKRNVAFESIFGRPTAAHHHQSGASSLNYQPSYSSIPQQQQQQQHPSVPSIPSSSQSSHVSYPAPLNGRPTPFINPNVQRTHHAQSSMLRASSVRTETRSHHSGGGVIVPQPLPEESEDGDLRELQQNGLTPAQAYQRQVFMNASRPHEPPPQRPTWEVNLTTHNEDPQHFFGSDIWDNGVSNLSITPTSNPRMSMSGQSLRTDCKSFSLQTTFDFFC